MSSAAPAFNQPSLGGNFLKPADLNGHLILITKVHEVFDRYDELAGKEKLNVRFDYVDLTQGPGHLIEDALSNHPGIALRLKPSAGKGTPVLGRIGQEAAKKQGFNAAWVLGPYEEGIDDLVASQWMAEQSKPVQPAQTAPAHLASVPPVQTAPPAAPAPSAAGLDEATKASMRAAGIAVPGE